MLDKTYRPYGLEPIETASRDEIVKVQTERLKWSLKHAYDNVPAYRKKYDDAGVHPDDFKRLEDLAKFPFTTKQDLRDNYPFGMFAVPQDRIARIHASSGTTGKPTVVGYTRKDIDVWSSVMARPLKVSLPSLSTPISTLPLNSFLPAVSTLGRMMPSSPSRTIAVTSPWQNSVSAALTRT